MADLSENNLRNIQGGNPYNYDYNKSNFNLGQNEDELSMDDLENVNAGSKLSIVQNIVEQYNNGQITMDEINDAKENGYFNQEQIDYLDEKIGRNR